MKAHGFDRYGTAQFFFLTGCVLSMGMEKISDISEKTKSITIKEDIVAS